MVAAVTYDEHSFWAGVAIGRRLKGYAAYGTMPGWDPDGDLIVRPVIQGIGRIYFPPTVFDVRAFIDTVDPVFPVHESPAFAEQFARITFAPTTFGLVPLTEQLVMDQIIYAYRLDKDSKDVAYNEDLVYINADDAFTVAAATNHVYTSAPESIDSGSLATVTIVTSDKNNVLEVVIS